MGWLKAQEGARLALAGIVVAAVLLVTVNMLAGLSLRGARLDLTDSGAFTVSDSTREVLTDIDNPITLRLYYSRILGEVSPAYGNYHRQVRELLERYVDMSGGAVQVEYFDPEPFSAVEDRAVAQGLQGVPVNQAGDRAYFGVVGVNSIDGREVIPFLTLERRRFLEYDLTRMVATLAKPQRTGIGILSSVPIGGQFGGMQIPGMPQQQEPWLIVSQVRDFFDVDLLDSDVAEIPDEIDTLMVVHPAALPLESLRAIDAFVARGGAVLMFVDPNAETAQAQGASPDMAALAPLLRAWGLEMEPDSVAADLQAAQQVSTGAETGNAASHYVAWLNLGARNFEADNPVTADLEQVNLATAAILRPAGDDDVPVDIQPLLFTGEQSMAVDVAETRGLPDIVGLLRGFQPSGDSLMLAARVSGRVRRAYSDEAPAEAAQDDTGDTEAAADAEPPGPPEPLPLVEAPANIIVVGDVDMLHERFWVQRQRFFGQELLIPLSNNADFVLNALESLTGGAALAGLRGRSVENRPFELIEELQREAERAFRAEEQRLQDRLEQLQTDIEALRTGGSGQQQVILTEEDRARIQEAEGEILEIREQLREVQLNLRRDIERVENRVTFINTALVPILLAGGAIVLALVRRSRRARAVRAAQATT